MNPTKEKIQFALKPDAQAFDKIVLRVEERFKDSELSGSEWRIGVTADFYRKEELISSVDCGPDMNHACGLLFQRFCQQIDNGNGFFGGSIDKCNQEGCSQPSKYLYRIKEAYDDRGKRDESYDGSHRAFCEKHSTRGDQSRGDNDSNYELITVL